MSKPYLGNIEGGRGEGIVVRIHELLGQPGDLIATAAAQFADPSVEENAFLQGRRSRRDRAGSVFSKAAAVGVPLEGRPRAQAREKARQGCPLDHSGGAPVHSNDAAVPTGVFHANAWFVPREELLQRNRQGFFQFETLGG